MPDALSAKPSEVSVVIPNFQGEKFIVPCLRSLLSQKVVTIRIVENGSTDRSKEEILRFLAETGYRQADVHANTINGQEKNVSPKDWNCYMPPEKEQPVIQILFLQENSGFCHGVNLGIQACAEKYVFLLNNDTTLTQGCVMELISFMDAHPKAFSAAAKMVSMKQPELADDCGDYFNALGYAFAAGRGKPQDRYRTVKQIFSACGGAAIYRRELFTEIGLFDENHFAYLEDVDLGYRARIYGYRNYFVPSAVVYHAGSGVSGSRHNEFKVRLSSRNSVYLVYKNEPVLQWLLNLPFLLTGYAVKTLFFMHKGLSGIYLRGLFGGTAFCFTKEARSHKVRFRPRRLGSYLKIQAELWLNILRMLTDGI